MKGQPTSKPLNGWYKMTRGAGYGTSTMVKEFEDDVADNGYGVEAYARMGFTFEPCVVLTVAEYDALLAKQKENV